MSDNVRDLPEDVLKELRGLHSAASELMAAQIKRRRAIRARWKSDAREILDAHNLAFGVVSTLVTRKSGVPGKSSSSVDGRLAVSASFIQGVEICEVAISEGLYVQAAAMLKQELEVIAALEEHRENRRKDKKTPNVGNASLKCMKEVYRDLNATAHIGNRDVLNSLVSRQLSEEVTGAFVYPIYSKEIAFYFYGLQVLLLILLASEIDELYQEMYGEELTPAEYRTLTVAGEILLEVGWLEASRAARPEEQAGGAPSPGE
jgi:hypothetical protein